MHILIVDDDKLICENIKSKLSRLGYSDRYTIDTAYNATDAEILYDRYLPTIMITDIHMPSVNGLALIRRLANRPHRANIVVLSSYDDYDYVRQAFLLGVADYMLKPVDIEELDSKLRKIEGSSSANKEPQREEIPDYGTERVMRHALAYIEENISRSISMREVSGHVGLSYNYFSKLFKAQTKHHFSHYLHLRRIELSKKYLHDPGFKIQDIAKKLGYENPSEFSRAFKKYAGCYPREYRERTAAQELESQL